MSNQHCRTLQVERFFRQCRDKLNMFNLFRLCRKGRNVVRYCCRLWQQSRMLLRQSRTLLDIVAGVDGALGMHLVIACIKIYLSGTAEATESSNVLCE